MASDNFTRANESPLAFPPWLSDSVFGGVDLVSNMAEASTGADRCSYYDGSQEDYSEVVIGAVGGAQGGPAIHCNGTGSCYFLTGQFGDTTLYGVFSGGGWTNYGSGGGAWSNSDVVALFRSGGDVVATVNASEVVRVTTAALSGGYDGLFPYGGGLRFSAWNNGAGGGGNPVRGLIGGKMQGGGMLLRGLR